MIIEWEDKVGEKTEGKIKNASEEVSVVKSDFDFTFEKLEEQWSNSIDIDELRYMEELSVSNGSGLTIRRDMKISNYLFLGINTGLESEKVEYLTILGKYHDSIYENQINGFANLVSIVDKSLSELEIEEIVMNQLGFRDTRVFTKGSISYSYNGVLYKSSYDEGLVQLEIKNEG